MKEILKVTGLNVNYGAIHAIHDVSLTVKEGEIVSLIGANGAGKTTILHTITGLKKAASGSVLFDGAELLTIEPYKIVSMGMAHVPEGRHVFAQMTVTENLEMGAFPGRIRKGSARIWSGCWSGSPASGSGAGSWPGPFPAASSRCWRWAGPS